MCDFDGAAEFSSSCMRKARKAYRCIECHGPIPAGSRHEYTCGKAEGEFYSGRSHLECSALWHFIHRELCGGHGVMLLGGLDEEIDQYSEEDLDADGEPTGDPTLRDIWDAIREGYERAATQ